MSNYKNFFASLLFFPFGFSLMAQSDVPAPAPKQQEKIYLTHATIHVGNGRVLNNATIGFENGVITFLEENPSFKTDETLGKVIDCTGKHIYPGLIAPATILGLTEIESVRATNDMSETGQFNPDARAAIAYNTDSRVTPTVRSNGVLYAQVVPQGGVLSGTSALVQLDAWNWEDALIKEDGVWLNWPSLVSYTGWWAEPGEVKANKDYSKQVDQVKTYFEEALAYSATPSPTKVNLRLEAMRDLFSGKKKLFVTAHQLREIQHAIELAEQYKINLVIVGGTDSYRMADVLAEKKIPVILGKTHDLPANADSDIDQPFKTPATLQKAGVLFCLSIPEGFWQERNLAFNAGSAVAYGLTKEQALMAVTLSAAKILGAEAKIGSLDKGKSASLLITAGDLLDMRTSNIERAFIDGRQIDLNNKQTELYNKFSKKYGQTKQ